MVGRKLDILPKTLFEGFFNFITYMIRNKVFSKILHLVDLFSYCQEDRMFIRGLSEMYPIFVQKNILVTRQDWHTNPFKVPSIPCASTHLAHRSFNCRKYLWKDVFFWNGIIQLPRHILHISPVPSKPDPFNDSVNFGKKPEVARSVND